MVLEEHNIKIQKQIKHIVIFIKLIEVKNIVELNQIGMIINLQVILLDININHQKNFKLMLVNHKMNIILLILMILKWVLKNLIRKNIKIQEKKIFIQKMINLMKKKRKKLNHLKKNGKILEWLKNSKKHLIIW